MCWRCSYTTGPETAAAAAEGGEMAVAAAAAAAAEGDEMAVAAAAAAAAGGGEMAVAAAAAAAAEGGWNGCCCCCCCWYCRIQGTSWDYHGVTLGKVCPDQPPGPGIGCQP